MRNSGMDMIKLIGTFSDFAIVSKKIFCLRNAYVWAGKVAFIEIAVSNQCRLTFQF